MLGCRESIFATKHTLHFGNLPFPPFLPQLLHLGAFSYFKLHVKCNGCPLRLPDPQPSLHPQASLGAPQPSLHPQGSLWVFPAQPTSPVPSAGVPIPCGHRWRGDPAPASDKADKKDPLCPGFVFSELVLKMEKTYFLKKSQSFYYSSSAPTSVSMLSLPTQTPQITPLRRGWRKVLVTRDDWVLGSCYTASGLFF